MSLFNEIADSLSKQNLANTAGDGTESLGSKVGKGVSKAFGGGDFGDALARAVTGYGSSYASGLINKYSPPNLRAFNAGTGAIGDILNGDFNNAGLRVFDSGLLDQFLPGASGLAAQVRYWNTPNPLFGGITPTEAKRIYEKMRDTPYCKKNLFLLEVGSRLTGDESGRFNLFATDIEFSPYTITGEKRKIGAGHADTVNSSDPVELRLTTYDDQIGSLKTWFAAHAQAAASSVDGTVGMPGAYAIEIKVLHGFISRESSFKNVYEDKGFYRPANIDMSLSRRENALEELQMTFVQLDTFMV